MKGGNAEQIRARDARVIAQVLEGERDMFRELVERYQPRAFGVALRLVANPADAADLVQQAFVDAFRALERFDPRRSFNAWLMRIVVNKCKDFLKSHKRRESHLTGEIHRTGALFTGRVDPTERVVEERDRLRLLEEALARLDEKYRIPLMLKEVEGMTYKEMGEVLDLPLTTMKIRVVRAREQIKEHMRCLSGEEK